MTHYYSFPIDDPWLSALAAQRAVLLNAAAEMEKESMVSAADGASVPSSTITDNVVSNDVMMTTHSDDDDSDNEPADDIDNNYPGLNDDRDDNINENRDHALVDEAVVKNAATVSTSDPFAMETDQQKAASTTLSFNDDDGFPSIHEADDHEDNRLSPANADESSIPALELNDENDSVVANVGHKEIRKKTVTKVGERKSNICLSEVNQTKR